MPQPTEVQFDGLVGPTHNYGGLSPGNVASLKHGGKASSPKAAALQGLAKMRFVRSLGVPQAVLPPHPRPRLSWLRRVGFVGRDEDVIAAAGAGDMLWLRLASSASSMWAANAATVAPSCDARDGRLHLVPANLTTMWHRALEADTTRDVLRAIFADEARFAVHDPLPGGAHLADEGAANHTRLFVDGRPAVHLFAWGRAAYGAAPTPAKFPARQTVEASRALARLLDVEHLAVFPQQHPAGVDGGAFHTDVVAVGDGDLLLAHELAFLEHDALVADLQRRLDGGLKQVLATSADLPLDDAVGAYPFNSQLLSLPGKKTKVVVAPEESRENPAASKYLARVLEAGVGVEAVHFLDLRESMANGGGPACLRLRVPMTDDERAAVKARVFLDDALLADLQAWVEKRYRDRLPPVDLADPALARESMEALDELTGILRLGSVYDFQRAPA